MNQAIEAHREAGTFFDVGGLRTFRRDEGEGEPVLLVHGVPASSFLYRKVVPELAARGYRAIAFDLPGLGLSDRPERFDYSWSGLGAFAADAVDALGLERFHLVVHDIGGPVGFELATRRPDAIASLTVLNAPLDAARFRKPWVMRPFEMPGLNRIWLGSMRIKPMYRALMAWQGIRDTSRVTREELNAWVDLLFGDDGGRAFLKIMGSFETTEAASARYRAVVSSDRYPRQIVWGEDDPALTYRHYGRIAEEWMGLEATRLPGKHFFQEDQPEAIAEAVARLAAGATSAEARPARS